MSEGRTPGSEREPTCTENGYNGLPVQTAARANQKTEGTAHATRNKASRRHALGLPPRHDSRKNVVKTSGAANNQNTGLGPTAKPAAKPAAKSNAGRASPSLWFPTWSQYSNTSVKLPKRRAVPKRST